MLCLAVQDQDGTVINAHMKTQLRDHPVNYVGLKDIQVRRIRIKLYFTLVFKKTINISFKLCVTNDKCLQMCTARQKS